MSLDLTIRSDKIYKSKGTGVFVRDAGGTRELQTIDEIKIYFPEFDINSITQEYYETYDVWTKNITHNLSFMASHVPVKDSTLYYYLWRPEKIGFSYVNSNYVDGICEAYDYLKSNKDSLSKYNSSNDCGTYEELLDFVKSLRDCLIGLKINYSDEFKIISNR